MAKDRATVTCPNCGQAAEKLIREGRTYILCESEDKVFEVTATGAKFRQRGRLDEIERRLAALEGTPAAEPTKDDKDDIDKDDIDNDDDENSPFLEITFGDDEDEDEDGEEADEDEATE